MLNDVTPPGWQRPKPKLIEPIKKPDVPPLHVQARAVDPAFKTPEELQGEIAGIIEPTVVQHELPKQSSRFRLHFTRPNLHWPRTRKQRLLAGALVVVLAFGIGAGWTLTHHKRAVIAAPPKKSIAKKVIPPPIYSTLSGLQVPDASVNQRTVTAVMIENSLDARPQSGLSEAGVVFEAVAEGGVTRFLTLFQDTAPDNVGPIRSARPYYVSWAMGFDAAYAHVGGSPDALADIATWGTHDMNQFSNGGSYHRTSDRAAPHNVYTAISTLNQLEATKGYTSSFTGFTRKSEQPYKAPAPAPAVTTATPTPGSKAPTSKAPAPATPADARTPVSSLDFGLSGYTYDPHFDYSAATNSYDRSEAGEPHMDANGGRRISPKIVIAMVVPLARGVLDSSGAYYSDYNVIGSGQAYIFQDGVVTTGQWSKASNGGALSFTDANGAPLPLNRGQTWISAVSDASKVSYK